MSDPLPFEKVSLEDAKKVLERSARRPRAAEGRRAGLALGSHVHPAGSAAGQDDLVDRAIAPGSVAHRARPRLTRALRMLMRALDEAGRVRPLLRITLTVDRRGHRQGFPLQFGGRVAALRTIYAQPNATRTVWNSSSLYRR